MLAEQRLAQILGVIKENEFVEVGELASIFNVSSMTIRRDLKKLSDQGLLVRRHGGAATLSVLNDEQNYSDKLSANPDGKKKIAQTATALIKNNDTVYLDGGTTALCIAHELNHLKDLTVVTNDIMIASELSSSVNLILLGGNVQAATQTVGGPFALDMLRTFRVSIAFIGTSSVDRGFDVFTPTLEKSYLKRTAMEISQQAYLLADSSKFYSQSLHRWGSLSDFTGVITDKKISEEERKLIAKKKIKIIHAL